MVATALYRRYRPDTFADLIGQEQVTNPLMTALRSNRVSHAYLFSGPRGCGKTTSARILARCLNCAEGPTDTPCGVCASCRELATGGPGSLDVVEIDAASHNGVDDARDLRERAAFAPARDRYKVFILDEAHMVTPQGFNALLKLVEEPPEHVKFIFATTEPEKVIGTIRSRTHHYPFRLVPPVVMLPYLESILSQESVTAEPGVLALATRAGGGSVRDTLSILDQLIAGSDGTLRYDRATGLLGFTPVDLLDQVATALSRRDAAKLFESVDRVIQTGQDPRRFVEDLLERFRDLIVVHAAGEGAASVLRGIQRDELERLRQQASDFGAAQLSRAADVTNAALSEMAGAVSPRIQLEILCARLLLPESDDTAAGTLSRLETVERRLGVDSPPSGVRAEPSRPTIEAEVKPAAPASAPSSAPRPMQKPASAPAVARKQPGEISLPQLRDAWSEILSRVAETSRTAWMVLVNTYPFALKNEVLTVGFANQADADAFRQGGRTNKAASILRSTILSTLGLEVRYLTHVDEDAPASAPPAPSAPAPSSPATSELAPSELAATPAATAARDGRDREAPVKPATVRRRPVASTAPAWPESAAVLEREPDLGPEPEHEPEPGPGPEPVYEPGPESEPGDEPELEYESHQEPEPTAGQAKASDSPRSAPDTAPNQQMPSSAAPPSPEPGESTSNTAQYGEAVIRERLRAVPIDDNHLGR